MISLEQQIKMKKKNNWFWNLLIIVALLLCAAAFALHYKNWLQTENDSFSVASGVYYQAVKSTDINSIEWVPKIPKMERTSGFSWGTKEKGRFLDSITKATVHVFVDDLTQQKIKIQYQDSLTMYLNLKDSVETQLFYGTIDALVANKE